jgi:hypothetical protein
MGLIDAILHGLNFLLPALFISAFVTFAGRFFKQKRPLAQNWRARAAIHLIVCISVLLLGLVITGRDGKMLTYLAMALACGTAQWVMSGGWRK